MTLTNSDLLKEISQKELQELSDLDATGAPVQMVIDDAIEDALSFISSFIPLPDTPTPLLKKIAVDLSIYELRRKNDLVSDEWEALRKRDEEYLLKMSRGTLPTTLQEQDSDTKKEYTIATRTHKKKINTKGWL